MPCASDLPLPQLAEAVAREKSAGKTIVLANGGFDLIHVGHVRYLQQAKALGDVLVVALNSDSSLKGLKGAGRALIDEQGRARIIGALACVDYVTLFAERTVEAVLRAIQPHLHCKGSDYSLDSIPERDVVRGYGGQLAIVGGEKVRSTSLVIRRIKELYG
ncbi:MAG: adenylyltransferase/cytidyltransferase family protein [Acidobacteria bacterium]|jgi:rfaE bifunctional protein nucleotidyltransferase chain/domain|nr:adenylyltransferase/cytidyltransferase family protein [Acidobacteriota bacterium]